MSGIKYEQNLKFFQNPPLYKPLLILSFQPVPKEMFEDALKELQDEDFLIVTNKLIRLCA